jgi:integrase
MALTDTTLRNARPREKVYRLNDGKGLLFVVNPIGTKYWRFRYEFHGRENMVSLGPYPQVSLVQARALHAEARKLLARGIDPARDKAAKAEGRKVCFKDIAEEWLHLQRTRLTTSTQKKARWMLDTFVYPEIGSRPLVDLRAPDILAMLRQIESKGFNETAKRVKQRCSQIFRYAIATGRTENDPTVALRGALAPVVSKNHAGITEPARIGELMLAIDGYTGHPVVKAAMKLSALTFVRPGELKNALWTEIDLGRREWRISAERMKMREEHIVPLSPQAMSVITELLSYRGESKYLLPSVWTDHRPISENTVNLALRRMGYSNDQMTAHGFRTTASTQLNELGYPPDVIELQLAHRDRNKVRASYNKALKLEERTRMMCEWADYLDQLRTAAAHRAIVINSVSTTATAPTEKLAFARKVDTRPTHGFRSVPSVPSPVRGTQPIGSEQVKQSTPNNAHAGASDDAGVTDQKRRRA